MSSESSTASAPGIVLHIWPQYQSVISLDASCVAALLFLQLSIPGRFSISHCTNPDLSPSGQLPFLTHGLHNISTFPSIVQYVSRLDGARYLDAPLSATQKAQSTARIAHAQSELGDLLNHMLYSLHANWWKLTRPALVSMLPLPQRYYVPHRVRESFKPRLEAVELWNVPGIEQEEDEDRRSAFRLLKKKKDQPRSEKFKKVFERERVLEKARAVFDVYAKLLGDRSLFYPGCDLPTTLDIVVAAHLHILANISFPDPLLQTLLTDSYPSLAEHSATVYSSAFPPDASFPPIVQSDLGSTLQALVPWPRFTNSKRPHLSPKALKAKEDERRFTLIRWGWIGLSVAAATAYIAALVVLPALRMYVGTVDEEVLEELEEINDPAEEPEVDVE